MKFASSRATTAALLFAPAMLFAQSADARAQGASEVESCRSIDYAFADRDRDYYVFDRNYSAPADQPGCDAPMLRQGFAAKQ